MLPECKSAATAGMLKRHYEGPCARAPQPQTHTHPQATPSYSQPQHKRMSTRSPARPPAPPHLQRHEDGCGQQQRRLATRLGADGALGWGGWGGAVGGVEIGGVEIGGVEIGGWEIVGWLAGGDWGRVGRGVMVGLVRWLVDRWSHAPVACVVCIPAPCTQNPCPNQTQRLEHPPASSFPCQPLPPPCPPLPRPAALSPTPPRLPPSPSHNYSPLQLAPLPELR